MLQMSVKRDYGIHRDTRAVELDVVQPMSSSSDRLLGWLDGHWALLFSHPDDFANYGFEADRWLVYLRETFVSLRVRPIAIGYGDGTGWISEAGGRFVPRHVVDDLIPTQGRSKSEHFVIILDSSMRARRTLLYHPGESMPSAIELAQSTARIRALSSHASVCRILQSV